MKINHIIESKSYLYEGLNTSDIASVMLWESAGQKLKEAELTADQIQQLFQQVEQGATAAGGNRTMLGKGKDAAGAVNKAWEDLKTKVQNSGPIQAVDQAYDSAVAKIEAGLGGPDNAVNQVIQKYRKFAKEHPIAQGFIYSALIAAAGISGAGLGGAAVLGLLKMADKLLQGEKFSSAAYSGAKTGAMAYGASKVGDMIKGAQQQSAVAGEKVLPVQPSQQDLDSYQQWSDAAQNSDRAAHAASWNPNNPDGTASNAFKRFTDLDQAQQSAYNKLPGQSVSSTLSGVTSDQLASNPTYQQVFADQMRKFGSLPGAEGRARQAATLAAKAALAKQTGVQSESYSKTASMSEAVDRRLTVRMWALNESLGRPRGGVHLTEAGIDTVFSQLVNEGPGWDAFKAGAKQAGQGLAGMAKGAWTGAKNVAGQAAGAVGKKLSTVGHNLTTKVTADKLMSAWKKAGSPTDSDQVAQVLSGAGVGPDVIASAYKSAGIPAPAVAPTPAAPAPGNVAGSPTPRTPAAAKPATPAGQAPAGTAVQGQPAPAGQGQTATGTTTTVEPAEPDQPGGIANAVTGALKGAQSAWERGTHTPLGASLVEPDTGREKDRVTVKDRSGKPLNYSKVGNQWVDAAGNPVTDPATVAMLDQQATAKTAGQTPAGTTAQPPTGTTTKKPTGKTQAGQAPTGTTTQPPASAPAAGNAGQAAPTDATTPVPAAKTHTGGKVAGQLSQTPGAIKKRQARAVATGKAQAGAGAFGQMANQLGQTGEPAATAPAAPAALPKFGPGVSPQMTVAPSKVSYKMPAPTAAPATEPKPGFLQTATDKIRAKSQPAPVAESIDLAEVLWRKMKSKR